MLEIIQGTTTVAESGRAYALPPVEIEVWVDDGKNGMENALRADPRTLVKSMSATNHGVTLK